MPSFPVGSLLLVSRQSAWNKRPYCCLVADGLVGNPMSELGQKRKFSTRAHVVRFTPECVAKLPLRRLANRDSVGLRRASAGAAHDGATGSRTRPVLLFL